MRITLGVTDKVDINGGCRISRCKIYMSSHNNNIITTLELQDNRIRWFLIKGKSGITNNHNSWPILNSRNSQQKRMMVTWYRLEVCYSKLLGQMAGCKKLQMLMILRQGLKHNQATYLGISTFFHREHCHLIPILTRKIRNLSR